MVDDNTNELPEVSDYAKRVLSVIYAGVLDNTLGVASVKRRSTGAHIEVLVLRQDAGEFWAMAPVAELLPQDKVDDLDFGVESTVAVALYPGVGAVTGDAEKP